MYFVRYPKQRPKPLYLIFPRQFIATFLRPKDQSEDDSPDRNHIRDWVVSELDIIFDMYGNPTPKMSVDVESALYKKSKNMTGTDFQAEYVALARRLLRTVLEMARVRKAEETGVPISPSSTPKHPFDARSFSLPSTPSDPAKSPEEAGPSSRDYDTEEYPTRPSGMVKPAATATCIPEQADNTIDYGLVPLPQDKPHMAFPEGESSVRSAMLYDDDVAIRGSEGERSEGVEIVTHVTGQEEGSSGVVLPSTSANTYEANMVFLVPRGYKVKKVDVTLEATLI